MTTLDDTGAPAPPAFSRTIDRALVHRAAVSEVLVTDLTRTGPEHFVAGAQLPLAHTYFSDHARVPATYDFLLLLEAARQAGTAASHQQLDVPADTVFLVHSWSIRIEDLDPLVTGTRPGELHLSGSVEPRRGRDGRLRGVRSEVTLRLCDQVVGRTRIDVGAVRGADYAKLRFLQRRSTPPLTSELDSAPISRAAGAASVGRRNPANVILTVPRRAGELVSAEVEPRFENSSLFDHSYDHVPAVVLSEAARQLAHLAGAPAGAPVIGCAAEFMRFAELDAPLTATTVAQDAAAMPAPGGSGAAGRRPGHAHFTIDFRQACDTVGRIALDFAPPTGTGQRAAWTDEEEQ